MKSTNPQQNVFRLSTCQQTNDNSPSTFAQQSVNQRLVPVAQSRDRRNAPVAVRIAKTMVDGFQGKGVTMDCGPRAEHVLLATSQGLQELRLQFPAPSSGSAEHGLLLGEMPSL